MCRTWLLLLALTAAACGGGGSAGQSAHQTPTSPAPVSTTTAANPTAAVPTLRGGSADAGRACAPEHFRLESTPAARAQAKRLVARMSLSEEVDVLHGLGMNGGHADSVGSTMPIPALGIRAINQEDGPGGVGDSDTGVTQLPAPIALAATFDPAAARCYGQVVGQQARAKGLQLIYGPTVNLVRLPQWGRAFESYGEDPYLSGTIGAADITGIQRAGVMAEAKHFAVYNQETYRNLPADDAIVAARTLQETYLKVWRLVAAADPAAIMCSYSTINGAAACQDRALIHDFLDRDLHYAGFVGSDYNATHSTVASALAGLDQEQPGSVYFGRPLLASVRSGRVPRAIVDEAATRVVTQMYRFRLFTDYAHAHPNRDVTTPADLRVATKVAEQGTVLLKNEGGVLPLSRSASIALIGPAASVSPVSSGGGTAYVLSAGPKTPLQGVRSAAAPGATISYTAGLPTTDALAAIPAAVLKPAFPLVPSGHPFTATLTAPQTGTYIFGMTGATAYSEVSLSVGGGRLLTNASTQPDRTYTAAVTLTAGHTYPLTITGPSSALTWATPSTIAPDLAAATRAAAAAQVAVVVVGDPQESEAEDRASLTLPSAQDELVAAVAAANPHTVVVVQAGAAVAMPWLSKVQGVFDQWYAGQTDGTALAAVLYGAANPSGHLPVTFPTSLAQSPVTTAAQFPGVGGRVDYSEGDDIGYRWFIDHNQQPLFPFGFGLSYTSFRYARPVVRASHASGHLVVTVREQVTNVGDRPGADVAQVYLGLPAAAGEPERQLEGFQRVSLAAGKSAVVTFRLHGLQLETFVRGRSWWLRSGQYRVYVGDSSATAQLGRAVTFRVASTLL
jgi:beta-glucosidase